MNRLLLSRKSAFVVALGMSFCSIASTLSAQVVPPSPQPIIGRADPVSAEPKVQRPATRACSSTLFTNLEFADYNTKNYTYTPPKNCPGPWAKVILKVDFTVTAGLQYDRTEQFYLGGANILFGTTAEPRAKLSPSWHVENDVTNITPLLLTPQDGTAILGNYVGVYNGVDYTGIIYATAQLVFYPVSDTVPAPSVPDVVIGIPGNGGAATLNSTSSQLTQSVTLPKNVEKAYLDVIAQSQSNDEFWYLCVPDDVASELESCGGTGYRETEISIDGTPAGVAPVYPWIFTGGIDPYLWEPIPGVQTLNFKPYRVDLTPFAAVLADGQPHTVAISVFNADSYFSATGNLLVYTDKGRAQTTGKLLLNTLVASPTPKIAENLNTDQSGDVTGSVEVSSTRSYTILGSLNTSHGVVYTTVNSTLKFANTQSFIIDETEYKQSLVQSTTGSVGTTTTNNGVSTVDEQVLSYPFTFVYDEVVNNDGSITVYNTSDQKDIASTKTFYPPQTFTGTTLGSGGTPTPFVQNLSNEVSSTDNLFYDANGNYTGHAGHATQDYAIQDSTGYCYSRTITAANKVVTGVVTGAECPVPAAQ